MSEWGDYMEMREYVSRTPEQKILDEICKIIQNKEKSEATKLMLIEQVIYGD